MTDGIARFVSDFSKIYDPYPFQQAFHASPKKFKLLGGAAGPGKTLALIVEQMIACNEFSDPVQAKQVHTLLLRRTFPKLEDTVITRFREKIPRELYKHYNEQKHIVTWHNGASTHFDSMQYEHDAYGKQGQWYKIDYDEMGEFTFKQWMATSAWNRCPVSPYATKGGASNPIGVGATWINSVFVEQRPCEEMDEAQRKAYNRDDYAYFPGTYLDNPIYANDPEFIAGLDSYPAAIRDALKYGKWGVAGGYFAGAWDPAVNIYDAHEVEIKPWWPRWISGDWGFDHWAANYWHCIDDFGVTRTYREFVTNHEPPKVLAESIVKHSFDEDGDLPSFGALYYSHDAFSEKQDANTVAKQMASVLVSRGLPHPTNAGRDRVGRGQIMYQKLVDRIIVGERWDEAQQCSFPLEYPAWQIERSCTRLINAIPNAPRDEKKQEEMAKYTGDDPIDGAGHGIYGRFGRPATKPFKVKLQEELVKLPIEGNARFIRHKQLEQKEGNDNGGTFFIPANPRFNRGRR